MKSRNLAIVFAGLCGYAERLGTQTWEESQRMLRLHEALVEPAFRKFGGRRVKQTGGTFLVAFDSPTQAVLCAAALRERVRTFDESLPPERRLQARVGIYLGEVRLDRGDVFGEPVNIASRIEAMAGPGEVLFGESVWLSMNRAEVRCEDAGERTLKGVPEPVRVFRLVAALSPLPELGPLPSPDGVEIPGEVSRHLLAAADAAARQAQDVLPRLPDKVRVFVGAGLAAMVAVAAAFFALARLGVLP
ncbi:MAG TPA: adenylate/guanylate cyclase domain-containing protein [Myxococcales bacterium]|nr:adenylate/guanylate cyclase domain-containing protein [Myxococcales bacterium]